MANVTPEYVAEIIDKFEVSDENKQRGVMGIEGNFLSSFTSLFSPILPFFHLGVSHSFYVPFPVSDMAHHQFATSSITLLFCLIFFVSSQNRSLKSSIILFTPLRVFSST